MSLRNYAWTAEVGVLSGAFGACVAQIVTTVQPPEIVGVTCSFLAMLPFLKAFRMINAESRHVWDEKDLDKSLSLAGEMIALSVAFGVSFCAFYMAGNALKNVIG